MRLGDLDALTGKLKNGLGNAKNAGKEDYAKIFEVFIDWVSREPTIDAAPVVRCRECKHGKRGVDNMVRCSHPCGKVISMTAGDFCSYGARMDGKEDEHEVS